MNEITSRDNQWVKMACSLKQKKGRQAHQRVFVEGLRVIADAAAMAIPDAICFVSEKGRALDGFEALYARGLELGWTFYAVTDSVYDKLKDTRTPQGLAAMLPFFAYTFDSLPAIAPEKAVLYLRSIQDPARRLRPMPAPSCSAKAVSTSIMTRPSAVPWGLSSRSPSSRT